MDVATNRAATQAIAHVAGGIARLLVGEDMTDTDLDAAETAVSCLLLSDDPRDKLLVAFILKRMTEHPVARRLAARLTAGPVSL